ncbi:LytTR family transcriptional regulator [Mucilaginibacter sp. JRF]|uniref:LytR/AlgR family response regulator transcription factor n=1 Tax=Mucilaginibacter sp. JRF TaxID=2780088 RepID=UPI00187E3D72|nr:LytTR family DNA-binding domain-containing protein [Mucilaginibacter sp. JRF]MBE9583337.1 LytTR family transcriptional regulator [Mucilaginibacter sp. JRF]
MQLSWPIPKARWRSIIIWSIVILIAAGIIQDYIQARLLNQGFYLSESLLFKAFWLPFIIGIPLVTQTKRIQLHWWLMPLVAAMMHVFTYAAIVFLISYTTFTHTYGLIELIKHALAEDTYKYLAVYISLALAFRFLKTTYPVNAKTINVTTEYPERMTFQTGKQNITLDVKDINFIIADDPYIAVHNQSKKHLISSSLQAIQTQLDPEKFVRIHRSTIVNLQEVESYTSRLNGDYDLKLKNGTMLRISRSYSKTSVNDWATKVLHSANPHTIPAQTRLETL